MAEILNATAVLAIGRDPSTRAGPGLGRHVAYRWLAACLRLAREGGAARAEVAPPPGAADPEAPWWRGAARAAAAVAVHETPLFALEDDVTRVVPRDRAPLARDGRRQQALADALPGRRRRREEVG